MGRFGSLCGLFAVTQLAKKVAITARANRGDKVVSDTFGHDTPGLHKMPAYGKLLRFNTPGYPGSLPGSA